MKSFSFAYVLQDSRIFYSNGKKLNNIFYFLAYKQRLALHITLLFFILFQEKLSIKMICRIAQNNNFKQDIYVIKAFIDAQSTFLTYVALCLLPPDKYCYIQKEKSLKIM